MKSRPIPRISSRKQPRQARSERLVADILEAAVRVLASGGRNKENEAYEENRGFLSMELGTRTPVETDGAAVPQATARACVRRVTCDDRSRR